MQCQGQIANEYIIQSRMNPLAEELNGKILSEAPHLFEMLSELGKRFYFPSKGILSQSAEAKKLAKDFNATIGTAMEKGKAMHLDAIMDLIPGLSPNVLLYAPSSGLPALRQYPAVPVHSVVFRAYS